MQYVQGSLQVLESNANHGGSNARSLGLRGQMVCPGCHSVFQVSTSLFTFTAKEGAVSPRPQDIGHGLARPLTCEVCELTSAFQESASFFDTVPVGASVFLTKEEVRNNALHPVLLLVRGIKSAGRKNWLWLKKGHLRAYIGAANGFHHNTPSIVAEVRFGCTACGSVRTQCSAVTIVPPGDVEAGIDYVDLPHLKPQRPRDLTNFLVTLLAAPTACRECGAIPAVSRMVQAGLERTLKELVTNDWIMQGVKQLDADLSLARERAIREAGTRRPDVLQMIRRQYYLPPFQMRDVERLLAEWDVS